ncbi:hypothetical protein GCM10007977_087150 [Dactylosporangium sucinum]|uniref:Uncharacterized protein n=1 Tax=Dactylosporangium sucinum TaxID=1424081 RepID=A0A917UC69_9ACTN|nr:hypothetical protein GCM10007977_087150 [Dactylosporangium sucinum]
MPPAGLADSPAEGVSSPLPQAAVARVKAARVNTPAIRMRIEGLLFSRQRAAVDTAACCVGEGCPAVGAGVSIECRWQGP